MAEMVFCLKVRGNLTGTDDKWYMEFEENCIHDDEFGNWIAKDDIEAYLQNFKECGMPEDELERIKNNLNKQL